MPRSNRYAGHHDVEHRPPGPEGGQHVARLPGDRPRPGPRDARNQRGQVGEVGVDHLDLEADGSLRNEAGQARGATHRLGGALLDGRASLLRMNMDGGVGAKGALMMNAFFRS
jgi:hypothetical protein